MAKSATARRKSKPSQASPLMVRLDRTGKQALVGAAALRGISVSDYVRTVTVAQARRELQAARAQSISLTPQEQLEFWNALNQPPRLTPAQRQLGKIMRASGSKGKA